MTNKELCPMIKVKNETIRKIWSNAKLMLENDFEILMISDITGLTEEEIKTIKI